MDSSNIIDYVKSNAKQLNKPKSIKTGHKLMHITFKAFEIHMLHQFDECTLVLGGKHFK